MSEIERLIDDLESCVGIFDYLLTPEDNNLLISYIKQLQQENQQLKEVNTSCISELVKHKYVLDEIRECIETDSFEINTKEYGNETVIDSDNLLQILDKVNSEHNSENV